MPMPMPLPMTNRRARPTTCTPAWLMTCLVALCGTATESTAATAPKSTLLRLVCAGVETVETIYGAELEPPRKGDFRVEYTFDLVNNTVANARTGKGTPVHITADEINFGSATDYHPGAKDEPTTKTIGPGAAATGVVIDRKAGKYFSIATRKRNPPPASDNASAASSPAASAASAAADGRSDVAADSKAVDPVQITNIRTRQGVCTDGTPSASF